jgi:multidrug efflux pump
LVLGVIPLITKTAPAPCRGSTWALVIASELAVGTLFMLFVVPAVYLLIATDHSSTGKVGTELADLPSH